MGWMNLASILLGLAGWDFLFGAEALDERTPERTWTLLLGSGLCCGGALWFQLGYSAHLAEIGDWPAWMDTADAVSAVSGFLLVTTALVNGAAVLLSRQEDD